MVPREVQILQCGLLRWMCWIIRLYLRSSRNLFLDRLRYELLAHNLFFFCIDASYVIGITYQTIDKNLISELLGGLQGMFHHCQYINICQLFSPVHWSVCVEASLYILYIFVYVNFAFISVSGYVYKFKFLIFPTAIVYWQCNNPFFRSVLSDQAFEEKWG